MGCGRGCPLGGGVSLSTHPLHAGGGVWELDPSPEDFLLFDLKMEHFCAVFKLDLTEEKERNCTGG